MLFIFEFELVQKPTHLRVSVKSNVGSIRVSLKSWNLPKSLRIQSAIDLVRKHRQDQDREQNWSSALVLIQNDLPSFSGDFNNGRSVGHFLYIEIFPGDVLFPLVWVTFGILHEERRRDASLPGPFAAIYGQDEPRIGFSTSKIDLRQVRLFITAAERIPRPIYYAFLSADENEWIFRYFGHASSQQKQQSRSEFRIQFQLLPSFFLDRFTSDRYAYYMPSFSLYTFVFSSRDHLETAPMIHTTFDHFCLIRRSSVVSEYIFQQFPYAQSDLMRVCCVRTIRHKTIIDFRSFSWIFLRFSRSIAIVWSALNLIQPADQPSLFYFWSESLERIRETINLHRWTAAASVRKHYYRQSYNYLLFFPSFLLLVLCVNSLRSNEL